MSIGSKVRAHFLVWKPTSLWAWKSTNLWAQNPTVSLDLPQVQKWNPINSHPRQLHPCPRNPLFHSVLWHSSPWQRQPLSCVFPNKSLEVCCVVCHCGIPWLRTTRIRFPSERQHFHWVFPSEPQQFLIRATALTMSLRPSGVPHPLRASVLSTLSSLWMCSRFSLQGHSVWEVGYFGSCIVHKANLTMD